MFCLRKIVIHVMLRGDLDHIFFQCAKYRAASDRLYNNLNNCKIQSPFNVLSLLSQFNKKIFDCFIGFLEEANILL